MQDTVLLLCERRVVVVIIDARGNKSVVVQAKGASTIDFDTFIDW